MILLPIEEQKVEGIGPSPLEEGVSDRDQEPTGLPNGAAITTSFGYDLNILLE